MGLANRDGDVVQAIDLKPPRDGDSKRNRKGRLLATVVTISLVVGIPSVFFGFCGWFLSSGNWSIARMVGCIGFVIGAEFVARIAPRRMFIYVPEWCAFVTQNAWWKSTMVTYGPGFHLTYFWEERNAKGNWWMCPIVKDFALDILTHTEEVIVVGKYSFRINLKRIKRAIGVDEDVIDGFFQLSIKGLLTRECANMSAEEAQTDIDGLNKSLVRMIMRGEKDTPSTPGVGVKFGKPFGIVPVGIGIEDVKFSAKITKADPLQTSMMQAKIVAALFGIPFEELLRRRTPSSPDHITDKVYRRMLNRAAVHSGAGKLNLMVFEGGGARPVPVRGSQK